MAVLELLVLLEQRVGEEKRAMLDRPAELGDLDRWDNRALRVNLAKQEKLEFEDLMVSLAIVVSLALRDKVEQMVHKGTREPLVRLALKGKWA